MAALTTAQIENLLLQAQSSGVARDTLAALRLYLTDRAADLDGAGRLELAKQMSAPTEAEITDQFLQAAGDVRKAVLQRGRQAVSAITDDEWQQIIGEGENAE